MTSIKDETIAHSAHAASLQLPDPVNPRHADELPDVGLDPVVGAGLPVIEEAPLRRCPGECRATERCAPPEGRCRRCRSTDRRSVNSG